MSEVNTFVPDDLLGLFSICTGSVSVQLNPHRCAGHTVTQWAEGPFEILPVEKEEMIKADRVIVCGFYLDKFGTEHQVYGGSVKDAAARAYKLAKNLSAQSEFSYRLGRENVTALAEALGEACVGEVDIVMNDFKTREWGLVGQQNVDRTLADWFAFEKEINPDDYENPESNDVAFPEALVNNIIAEGTVFDVQFYPVTSVGSYRLLHSEAEGVLKRALDIAKGATDMFEHV